MDPTVETALPPQSVNAPADSFLGIPYGWPLAAAAVLAIILMWMAREPMRRMIWQVFFATGRIFSRWGFWLVEHGRNARLATAEKIAAHRAEELAERMIVLEDRLGRRAEKLPKETGAIILKLDGAADSLDVAANGLSTVNVDEVAERALRSSMLKIEEGRGLSKIEKNTAVAAGKGLKDQLSAVRPALLVLKTEAPRVREAADRLGKIEMRFNQGVDTINKCATDFEETIRSEDRIKVAGKQSIVIPWLIGLLITVIALSGVFLNFFLIERPMAEIVGEGAKIGGIGLPTFAAMIVIFLEFVAGVVLMDAAGFTRLIPTFQTMSDGSRRLMFWVAFAFLASFSFLEAALAIVREQIIEANQETSRLALDMFNAPPPVTGAEGAAPAPGAETAAPAAPAPEGEERQGMQLIVWAQIVLAVLIPWLLATAALPLETIIRNSVFILQMIGAGAMLVVGFVCKTIANALKSIGLFLLSVYDLVIFAPLWIERRVKGDRGAVAPPPPAAEVAKPPKRRREREAANADPLDELELQKAS